MTHAHTEPRISAIIIDDEERARASLRLILEHHFPQIHIIAEAATCVQAIKAAQSTPPDLVFLDIMLPDGSAFDFLDILEPAPFKVIITSAFPEHSIRAFKYAAIHYLLKPIDIRDLREAIARITNTPHTQSPETTKTTTHTTHDITESIALHSLEGFKLVNIPDIIYCEADTNYTIFHFTQGSTFTVANTLGYYEELLTHKAFYRIHNKYLVNLKHIQAYHKGRGGQVQVTNGKTLEVSTRKRDGFLQKLAEYVHGIKT